MNTFLKYLLAFVLGSFSITGYQAYQAVMKVQPGSNTGGSFEPSPDEKYRAKFSTYIETLKDGKKSYYYELKVQDRSTEQILLSHRQPAGNDAINPRGPEHIFWSPDSTAIVFGTADVEVFSHHLSFYLSPFDQHDDQTSGIEKPANDIAELPALLKLIDADPQIYLFEGPPTGYYRYPNKIKLPLLTRFGYLFKRQGDHVLNDEHKKELIQVLTNPSHYSPLTSRNHHKPYRPDYAIQFSSGIDKVEIALSYRNHSARISHNGKETHYLNFHYPTEDTSEDPFRKVLHEYRDFIFVTPLTHPEENSEFEH